MSVGLLAGCERGNETPRSFPILLGSWRTTHQEFTLEVTGAVPSSKLEEIKNDREQHTSISVSNAESYRLSFKGGGKGSGSGVRHDGNGRFDFGFTWEISDGFLSYVETKSGYGGVFIYHNGVALESMSWEIEMITPRKMVLKAVGGANLDAVDAFWTEIYTYRYVFEKMN